MTKAFLSLSFNKLMNFYKGALEGEEGMYTGRDESMNIYLEFCLCIISETETGISHLFPAPHTRDRS